MKFVFKKLSKRRKNESGQGMLEYVMLLGAIAVIIIMFKGKISQTISSLTDQVGQEASQATQSTGP